MWERGYGLRTALNLLYPRSVHTEPGEGRLLALDARRRGGQTVRTRQQASRAGTFEIFEIDRLRELVNGATGRPVDTQQWGTRVSGADALHLDVDRSFENLGALCENIAGVHSRPDYRDRFGWLDQIQPVTDALLIERLEAAVLHELRDGASERVDLALPEVVDWERVRHFQFFFDGRAGVTRPDLRLGDLVSRLRHDGVLDSIDAHFLRTRQIKALDSDGAVSFRWAVWRCLTAELDLNGETYVLDDGAFFAIDRDYLRDLNDYVDCLPEPSVRLTASEEGMHEDEYNERAVAGLNGQGLLLDRQLVTVSSVTTTIEICDILTKNGCLIHVKRDLGSSDLSHLFAQGYVSAELLQTSPEFRLAARDTIERQPNGDQFQMFGPDPLDTTRFEVVYAIIAKWRNRALAKALPFFSKINLRRTAQQLTSRGFRVSCLRVGVRV